MKNCLLTGAVLLVLGGFMAGCSHDEGDYSSIIESKKQAYQEVFVDAYGTIDPKQDWGFKNITKAGSAQTGNVTRAISITFSDSYDFPDDADDDKFLSTLPSGVEKYATVCGNESGYASGTSYLDPSWTGAVNIWGANGTGGTLYIVGYNDFTNRSFYVAGYTEVYLLSGATLVLNKENAANLQTYCKYYVASGAKIVTENELVLNNGMHIYNHGRIEAGKLSTNNNSVLINSNVVNVTGKISVENTLSVIVNDGDLTAAELNTAGSGKFQNNANTTISGITVVNSNDNTWINNGYYHTGYFIYNAASDQVINNCRLVVDNDFDINLGDNPGNGCFRMNGGSGVFTRNFNGGKYTYDNQTFNGGPFYIYMGSGSVFQVSETATMCATKADYGIYNLGDNWSVFEAGDIVAGQADQGYLVTYGGKLGVVAKTHFAQGYSGQYPYIDFKYGCSLSSIYAEGFNVNAPGITVEPSECNPGFGTVVVPIDQGETTEDKIAIDSTLEYYETKELIEQGRVFCEDLGQISTNDLDFNDVVFDAYVYRTTPYTCITVEEDGEEVSNDTLYGDPIYKTEIVLLAAGGTLQLSLAGSEVHNAMGGHFKTTIINTIGENDEGYGNQPATNDPVVLGTDYDYESIVEIPIFVLYENGETLELTAEQGWAPHKILVPIGTKWCKERVNIADAYTNFLDYVGSSQDFWEGTIASDKVYTHPKDNYQPRSEEPVVTFIKTVKRPTTYRSKGTSTTTGGYDDEPVLSRELR